MHFFYRVPDNPSLYFLFLQSSLQPLLSSTFLACSRIILSLSLFRAPLLCASTFLILLCLSLYHYPAFFDAERGNNRSSPRVPSPHLNPKPSPPEPRGEAPSSLALSLLPITVLWLATTE